MLSTRSLRLCRPAVRCALLALVAALVALDAAPPAAAHEGVPGVRTVLDEVDPALDPFNVQVVFSAAPQLVLENPTPRVVEILDDEDVPFLRIGPDGVEGNLSAAAWYRTNDPFGETPLPDGFQPGQPPRWGRVSREPSWGWFDHRLHPGGIPVPQEVRAAGRTARLAEWTVPFSVDGERTEARGHVEYRPQRGIIGARLASSPTPVPGLSVAVLPGRAPGLYMDNATGEPAVVMGSHGEPFLRIGRDGVEANERSPAWLAALRGQGQAPDQEPDPEADPVWTTVSDAPRYGWIEERGAYPDEEPPPEQIDRATDLVTWTVPVLLGARPLEVQGVTTWMPLVTSTDAAEGASLGLARTAVLAAAGVLVAGAVALGLRGRRRPGGAESSPADPS